MLGSFFSTAALRRLEGGAAQEQKWKEAQQEAASLAEAFKEARRSM